MARVTIEDCVGQDSGRFELVLLCAKRAKLISSGSPSYLGGVKGGEKPAVTALRERAAGLLNREKLQQLLIQSCQKKQLLSASASESDLHSVEEDLFRQDEVAAKDALRQETSDLLGKDMLYTDAEEDILRKDGDL